MNEKILPVYLIKWKDAAGKRCINVGFYSGYFWWPDCDILELYFSDGYYVDDMRDQQCVVLNAKHIERIERLETVGGLGSVAKLKVVAERTAIQLTQWYDSLSNKEDEHAYWIYTMLESLKSALAEFETPNAPSDIDALLAEVERLREANATLYEKWRQLTLRDGVILIK